ncbi:MAG: flavodoxin family protein, partial [Planctomycetota bacterium]|nr:flavodoxin family protein [Planctomycetota bacterium]
MLVVTINGSPRKNGNTSIALDTVSKALNAEGIATKRIDIGDKAIRGCIACGRCGREQDLRCVFNDDPVNDAVAQLAGADGMVVGSPVYFAGINGTVKCFLDRVFFVAGANGSLFRHKVGAGVVAVRRGGETTAWDQLNKYFTISEMLVPGATYWNMLFGM